MARYRGKLQRCRACKTNLTTKQLKTKMKVCKKCFPNTLTLGDILMVRRRRRGDVPPIYSN